MAGTFSRPTESRFRLPVGRAVVAAALALGALGAHAGDGSRATLTGGPPLVIAHRGASGYLPEHTLEAYRLAIEMGADFIEPDLVATRDGALIVRHEPMLGGATDVAERAEFAARRTTRKVDGVDVTDWFACDFTLAEIKRLRARQALPERDQSMNGKLAVPTFAEAIALAKAESARLGRPVGLYPELKHPSFHAALGLPLEDRLLDALREAGWTDESSPVIVQSFEPTSLQRLRGRTRVRLAQLIGGRGRPYDFVVAGNGRSFADLAAPAGLAEIARYADGVAPWKGLVLDRSGQPTGLTREAHALGLFVHVWTFRAGSAVEHQPFYALGVDGVFADFPDLAVRAR